MSKTVHPILEALFAGAEPSRQPVNFSWRLIRRKGRPLILLPPGLAAARTGLNLYSAQRWQAKLWRALLPLILQTPAAKLFEATHFEADATSEIMQFMARQMGTSGDAVSLAAIKFCEARDRSRLVLLLCDESGRPTCVIKAGLNAAGQKDTNQEANFLEKLPANTIGCIRMTGRIKHPGLSAFATSYFPGESPGNDVGMEHLFQAWLNTGSPVRLESLPTWRELDAAATKADPDNWQAVKKVLAGKTVRTTLYHGDFAPWNVRAVNSQNLRAFDWERGQLEGIPGWDWFHFIIQTSILPKRYSTERVAAEVEQLLHSERFKKYAATAGISDIVQPLLLAYLLNHRWVFKPMEGGRATVALFSFLSAHWQLASAETVPDATSARPTRFWPVDMTAIHQLRFAAEQWNNLFWEPDLNSSIKPSPHAQFRDHWPVVLITMLLLTAIATAQFHSNTHLMFLPFYIMVCALITWKIDRRWGALVATVAAVVGPLMMSLRETGSRSLEIVLWNTLMRFIILQMCVLFVDRIHLQKTFFRQRAAPGTYHARLADTWAVVLFSGILFIAITGFDIFTDPHLIFLPLYLFPCIIMTLVLSLRWGIATTLLATIADTLIEYYTNKLENYTIAEVFFWNFLMRWGVFLLVILLLDRIRRENILFSQRKTNGN